MASSDGYLDRLHAVYDVSGLEQRAIEDGIVAEIASAYAIRDYQDLVRTLLRLDKFPFDDIYVGFLRKDGTACERNPETVERIARRVLSMPVEDLIRQCKQPKVDNRRMGELFHNWLIGLGYPKLDEDDFYRSNVVRDLQNRASRILMLNGSRKDFRDFANERLGCGLEKELDILVKVNGQYIIGEAKYFSGFGGHQNDQFEDAMNFLMSTQGDATRITVLDGVVWLDTNDKMSKKIRRVESIAMSALLLTIFLTELQIDVQTSDL